MEVTFNWSNYSDPTTQNEVTSLTVGSTHAATTNGSIAAGDTLLVVMVAAGSSDPGTIAVSGFTALVNTWDTTSEYRVYIGWKTAGASEAGTYTASWSATAYGVSWALLDFSGAAASPVDAYSTNYTDSSSTNMLAAACSPTGAADLLVAIWGAGFEKGPYTIASGITLRADVNASGSAVPEILIGTKQLTAAGSTGTFTSTMTTAAVNGGFLVALRPGSLPTVRPTTPPGVTSGVLPLLEGGGQRWAQDRINSITNALKSQLPLIPSNAQSAPIAPQDGQMRLARSPWWPVSGQSADAWVYYDGAAAIWRLLTTAPTTTG